MICKANEILEDTKKTLGDTIRSVEEHGKKFVVDCEEKKKQVASRYESFFARWKWLDYLVIADLLIMPIIIGFLVYKVFIVWG